ncbi:MAG: hypothetical protein ABSH22_19450 [Tepidisphaeraceae bacterium]
MSLINYDHGGLNIIGLYADGIIPIGAGLLGMVSASGYALAAWFLGCRIGPRLLCAIGMLTLLAYFGMQYIEFKAQGPLVFSDTGQPVSFLQYYDLTTRALHFEDTSSSRPADVPHPAQEETPGLGLLGYGVRVLEIAAFSLGAVGTPIIALRRKRFCGPCERYYTTFNLAVLPASVPLKKVLGVFSPSKAVLDGEHAIAGEQALEVVQSLVNALENNDPFEFNRICDELQAGSRAAKKLPRRIALLLSRCRQCGQAVFHPTMYTGIDARKTTRKEVLAMPLDAEIGDAIRPRF